MTIDWNFFNLIIVIVVGLAIGSLLNVVILRFDDLKSIINTRSHCPSCKRVLSWYELIPFFSYIALFGKCRTCKKTISIQYPLVETGTAIIFGLLYLQFQFKPEFFVLALITCFFVIIFVYDILHYLIADILVWITIGIWIIWLLISYFIMHSEFSLILNSLYGGLALGGLLALLVVVSREKWMGAGDIKLGFILGAIMGWPNVLVGCFAAFTLGSIVGLILLAQKKKTMKDQVPFAPFLISGMFIALFLGTKIVDWYLTSLGF